MAFVSPIKNKSEPSRVMCWRSTTGSAADLFVNLSYTQKGRFIIMNETKTKGLLTELQCQAYLTGLGYNISVPLGEDCRYDFIIDVDGMLIRVQVKHCRITKTGIQIACRSTQANCRTSKSKSYSKDEIDYFATYFNNKCYLIKVEECSTCKTLSFSDKITNQHKVCRLDNYEAERQIQYVVDGTVEVIDDSKVYQYDLKGNLVNTYDSCRDAARNGLGDVSKSSKISQCVRGIRKTVNGYKWTDTLIKG